MEKFIVRKYKEGDEAEINRLFNNIFGEKRSLDEWSWKFRKNPLGNILLIGLAESEGHIVGQYANLPTLFKYKNKHVQVGLPVDNFVHPDFRGGMKGIQKTMFEFQNVLAEEGDICFGLGFPNREAYIVGKRILKYKDVGQIPVLFKRLNFRLAVKNKLPYLPSFFLKIAQSAGGVAHKIFLRKRALLKAITVTEISSFDSRFDSFWEKVKDQHEIISIRDQKYLNWRFKKPGNDYRIFTAESSGDILGYIVIKIKKDNDSSTGYFVDLLSIKSSGADSALIQRALLEFVSEKVDFALCWMLKNNEIYNTLKSYGFTERESFSPVNFVYFIFQHEKVDELFLKEINNWYITMSESDTF